MSVMEKLAIRNQKNRNQKNLTIKTQPMVYIWWSQASCEQWLTAGMVNGRGYDGQ